MGKLFLAALILIAATAAPLLCTAAIKVGLETDHAATVLGLVCWAFAALVLAFALANSGLYEVRSTAYRQGQQDAIRPENLTRLQRQALAEADPSPM